MSAITSSQPFQSERSVRRSRSRTELSALLVCGLLSSAVYVVANVVAGLRWDGYSFASQAISELSAIDAPSRPTWIPFGIAYAVLLGAFGVGVWKVAKGRRGLRTSATMFIAMAVLGPFWPPMHMRGTITTLTDTMHIVFASVVSLMILLSIACGANASGRTFRRYSIATIAVLLVFGALTFVYAPALGANQPTPWLGVVERIMLAANMSWVAALSIVLLRRVGSDQQGHSPDRPAPVASLARTDSALHALCRKGRVLVPPGILYPGHMRHVLFRQRKLSVHSLRPDHGSVSIAIK